MQDEQVEVREAASVILLREGARGPQVWMMERVTSLAFAAGMNVFPGGKVDPDDSVTGSMVPEAELAARARQLATTNERVGALVSAAARETFEEATVLLTDPIVVAPSGAHALIEARESRFSDLLRDLHAAPAAAAILPWSRWITPPGESRRYDTYFFVAAAPAGSEAAATTGEAAHGGWVDVQEAIEENRRGMRVMLPPTFSNLSDVAGFATVADVLSAAAHRSPVPVRPVLRWRTDGGLDIALDGGRALEMSPESVRPFAQR